MPYQDQRGAERPGPAGYKQLSEAQRDTLAFLKQSLLQNSKFPQKLTFNFIKQFCSDGQSVSFNELNLRKCLTIRLKQPETGATET